MKSILFLFLFFSTYSSIAETTCPGKVTRILDWPSKCDGKLAFKLSSTNGKTAINDKWWCTLSDKSASMVLTAYASNKTVHPRFNPDTADSCSTVKDYHEAMYIWISN